MTNPTNQTDDDRERERDLERLETDLEKMERPDRAIPLPGEEADEDGAGPTTGVVP